MIAVIFELQVNAQHATRYFDVVAELKPQHVIVAGIVSAALFVVVLVVVVKWVVGSGVAAG